jgi:hypothetical protein
MSEASKLPDLASEVYAAVNRFNDVDIPKTHSDLELLSRACVQVFQVETVRRTKANLKNIEVQVVKAKHAVTDTEEDFV